MKRLIVHSVPVDVDITKDLFLGPWSFINLEDQFPGWDEQAYIEPDAYLTEREAVQIAPEMQKVVSRKIHELGCKLNKRLGTCYSYSYWRVVLYHWVCHFLEFIWDRQVRVRNLIAKYAEINLAVVFSCFPEKLSFNTMLDYSVEALKPDFDEYIVFELLKEQLPDNWQIIKVRKNDLLIDASTFKKKKKLSFAKKTKNKVKEWLLPQLLFRFSQTPLSLQLLFSLILYSKSLFTSRVEYMTFIENEEVNEITWDVDIDSLLEQHIPKAILECANKRRTRKFFNQYHISEPFLFGEKVKHSLGLTVEQGGKAVICQHGAVYGTALESIYGPYEYKFYQFISWGWKEHMGCSRNIVPLPSPLLSETINKHQFVTENIVFVSDLIDHCPRFHSSPQALEKIKYRKIKKEFLSALPESIHKKIRYRERISAWFPQFQDFLYLKKTFPDLQSAVNLDEELLSCLAVIIDYPGTTFLKALATNTPVIAYWDETAWPLAEPVKADFEKLKKVGVLHDSPLAAAEFLKKKNRVIKNWWTSDEVQRARKDFVAIYAKTSRHWKKVWLKYVINL
jgi:putative transferase (TIGR04331 family)